MLVKLVFIVVSFQSCFGKQMFLTATEMKDLWNLGHDLAVKSLSYYAAETERLDELEKFLNNLETQMELRGNEKTKRNTMGGSSSNRFLVSHPTNLSVDS